MIFRPLIARMVARGHEVTVTARDFAQTLGLLERYGIPHEVHGAHGGAGRAGKARAMASRTTALTRFARRERFDVAIAHGSTDQPPAAYAAGTPQVDDVRLRVRDGHAPLERTFRHARAGAQRHSRVGAVAVRYPGPEARWYPGLKEEYYLADHVFDPGVMDELGLDGSRVIAVLRPPPEVTLYHRGLSSDVFSATLGRLLDAAPEVQTVVLPRTEDQRNQLAGSAAIVPERPVDGPSLVAAADLVVSAGGTMNREAAALGVPAYSPFAGPARRGRPPADRLRAPAPARRCTGRRGTTSATAACRRPTVTRTCSWT